MPFRIFYKKAGQDLVGVRHRYSEFEQLRGCLEEKFSPYGLLVPQLPPKKAMQSLINSSTVDNSFVKERTYGLSLFCEAIVQNPFLRNDVLWASFMNPNQGAMSHSASSHESGNVGELMISAIFRELESPYKFTMQQRVEELRHEISSIETIGKTRYMVFCNLLQWYLSWSRISMCLFPQPIAVHLSVVTIISLNFTMYLFTTAYHICVSVCS